MILVGAVDGIDCFYDMDITREIKIGSFMDLGNYSYMKDKNGFCMAKIPLTFSKILPDSFQISKIKWISHSSTDLKIFKNIIDEMKKFDKKEKTKKRIKEVTDEQGIE